MKGFAQFVHEPISAEVCPKGEDGYLSITFKKEDKTLKRMCERVARFAGLTDLLTTLEYRDGRTV